MAIQVDYKWEYLWLYSYNWYLDENFLLRILLQKSLSIFVCSTFISIQMKTNNKKDASSMIIIIIIMWTLPMTTERHARNHAIYTLRFD